MKSIEDHNHCQSSTGLNHPTEIETCSNAPSKVANDLGRVIINSVDSTNFGHELVDDPLSPSTVNSTRVHVPPEHEIINNNQRRNCGSGCNRLVLRFPRTSLMFLGVVIPLWVLVILCYCFGHILARIEAPSEIVSNNHLVASQFFASNLTTTLQNLTYYIPKICWALYFSDGNREQDQQDLKGAIQEVFWAEVQESSIVAPPEYGTISVNATGFLRFLNRCANAGEELASTLLTSIVISTAKSGNLTFSWIRCTPDCHGLGDSFNCRPTKDQLRPEAQQQHFTSVWESSQQSLFTSYYSEEFDGSNAVLAKLKAYKKSLQDASGGEACSYNTAASAFVWFTLMASIGYGNQVPETTAGRSMMYTFGFLSILLFAGVLFVAGYVVSSIFDDVVCRFRLYKLKEPWAQAIVWGSGYYSWMVMIAAVTRRWKLDRLGVDLSSRDSYWFAYISTTTVGFGDIYLEPAVFTRRDLFVFPLLFLVGFVYLSAFLENFATFLNNVFRGGKSTPYLHSILSQLATTDMVGDAPFIQGTINMIGDIPVIQNSMNAVLPEREASTTS